MKPKVKKVKKKTAFKFTRSHDRVYCGKKRACITGSLVRLLEAENCTVFTVHTTQPATFKFALKKVKYWWVANNGCEVSICREGLVKMFGHTPRKLYIEVIS